MVQTNRITFQNPILQSQLLKNGYVVLDLLPRESLDSLREFYSQTKKTVPPGPISTTQFSSDRNHRHLVDNQVRPLITRHLESLLPGYKSILSYFFHQNPGFGSRLRVHQDWTVVDESKFTALTIWCPLVDTNFENGPFHVVTGSHLFLNNHRGTNITLPYESILPYIEHQFTSPLYLKAGQAIIYDQRLWHFSPDNMSNSPLPVAATIMIPEEAPLLHCIGNKGGDSESVKVDIFNIKDDFFISTNFNNELKLSNPIARINQNGSNMSETDFDNLIGSNFKTSRKILHDKNLEVDLLDKGFVKIPLLSKEQVEACKELFNRVDAANEKSRYNSLEILAGNHRETVNAELKRILGDTVLSHLDDYKFIGFNLAVKRSGPKTEFPVHIDDIHVNEAQGNSINCWIPLVDVSEHNGTLYMVPGSHKLPQPLRGIGLPFAFEDKQELINKFRVKINMKAGDALLFHSKMIHGSDANLDSENRPAIIIGTIPAELEPIVFMRYESKLRIMAEKFYAPESFYENVKIGSRPSGFRSMGMYDYQPVNLSDEEFIKILETSRP